MTKLKWDRPRIGPERADRPIPTIPSALKKELRILAARRELLEQTKQRGLAEKRKPVPDFARLVELREEYRYRLRLVRASQDRVNTLRQLSSP
jgi:hypothetical protein